MNTTRRIASAFLLTASFAAAQTGTAPVTPATQQNKPSAAVTAAPKTPLQLQSLDPGARPDPFPATNPKYFTADSPSVATVDAYLRAMLGYDSTRIWRVAAIQKTSVPGVSKVTAFVSDKNPNAKIQTASFIVLADGKHLVADAAVQSFGANPFAVNRALLQARANGPARGSTSKDLMFVEFADVQGAHGKEAQATMAKLASDFPTARIVYQPFPLTDIHPFAFRTAAYGVCIAQHSDDAFFAFMQAVYDTQTALTADAGEQTLKAAAAKAAQDPEAIAICASGAAAKATVDASSQLATELGVEQTPVIAINGRILPIATIPYETLKNLIAFQAGLDGIAIPAMPLILPKQ